MGPPVSRGPVPAKLAAAKRFALQLKFREYDTSGDGKLDKCELKSLLTVGNPSITDDEVTKLFRLVDRNNDGTIDFEEFVDFIFDQSVPLEEAPDELQDRLAVLFGEGMDLSMFQRMCSDCRLIDARFRLDDIEMLFAKVRTRGRRRIGLDQIDRLVCYVAYQKGVPPSQVHEQIIKSRKFMHCGPVERPATVAACIPESPIAMSNSATVVVIRSGNQEQWAYRSSQRAAEFGKVSATVVASGGDDGESYEDEDEEEWNAVERTFLAFCRSCDLMDRSEFVRLCDECSFFSREFKRPDAEILFASALTPKNKRIGFTVFRDLVRIAARRRGVSIYALQRRVVLCDGPRSSGAAMALIAARREAVAKVTPWAEGGLAYQSSEGEQKVTAYLAEASIAAEGGQEVAGFRSEASIAAEVAEDRPEGAEDLSKEMDWNWVQHSFDAFREGADGLDSIHYRKLCETSGLFDQKFSKNDADVIFTNYLSKKRRVSFERFKHVIRDIARWKKVSVAQIQREVGYSRGPKMIETAGNVVRLHDDVSGYTGAAMAARAAQI